MTHSKTAIEKACTAFQVIYGVTVTPWHCERLLKLLDQASEADYISGFTAPVVAPPPPEYDACCGTPSTCEQPCFHRPAKPAGDGWGPWIEWKGGECPVAGDIVVKCKLNRGNKFALMITLNANNLNWLHYEDGLNIVAYCVKI